MLRALTLDLAWVPEIQAAVKEGLPLDYLVRLVRQETPLRWRHHVEGDGAVLVADALQELFRQGDRS